MIRIHQQVLSNDGTAETPAPKQREFPNFETVPGTGLRKGTRSQTLEAGRAWTTIEVRADHMGPNSKKCSDGTTTSCVSWINNHSEPAKLDICNGAAPDNEEVSVKKVGCLTKNNEHCLSLAPEGRLRPTPKTRHQKEREGTELHHPESRTQTPGSQGLTEPWSLDETAVDHNTQARKIPGWNVP